MDQLSRFNRERWNELAQAGVQWSRPFVDLDATKAAAWLAERTQFLPGGVPEVAGKEILCLAGGGGQQTAVFALLGARVTVFDLSDAQLQRDRETAARFGYPLTVRQGDMRDLSTFADASFDLIWHPFSINFVPDAAQVIAEAGRLIRPGGFYHLEFANPFWSMEEGDWTETGYPIRQPYETGTALQFTDPHWEFTNDAGQPQRVEGPREFMHTLGTIFNGLTTNGFCLIGFHEGPPGNPEAAPGTWDHLLTVIPPFFSTYSIKMNSLSESTRQTT